MAKLTDEQIIEAFELHLQPGETLKTQAFGVKQPNILLMIPLFILAIIPGIIATAMLTRNYIVGLTDRRLIVLQVKSIANAEVKELIEYPLEDFASNPAKTKTGAIFTTIRIDNEQKPFVAKFHRAFSKPNRPNAMAIGEAIAG